MPATLEYRRGGEARDVACGALLTIGRTPPNDVVVPHPKVSRSHALIRMLNPGDYYVIDVGSTNGTFLNGRRVVVPTLLADGDVIRLEDCLLTFRQPQEARAEPSAGDEEGPLTLTMTSVGVQVDEITLLVCDIRNYTAMSESMPADALAALMAHWFKLATRAVEACGGTIDKFIGDAILVRWAARAGADDPGSLRHALEAAVALDGVCRQVNARHPRLAIPFRVGVGINAGPAVLGSLGGAGYREYTVIGDAVNMAFRFEGESKRLGKDVVVGADACAHLPRELWAPSLQAVAVKGKREPADVWALTFGEAEALLAGLPRRPEGGDSGGDGAKNAVAPASPETVY